jgi:hypothetical protein
MPQKPNSGFIPGVGYNIANKAWHITIISVFLEKVSSVLEDPKVWSADQQWSMSFIQVICRTGITKNYETKLINIHKQAVLKRQDSCRINEVQYLLLYSHL